MRAESRIGRTPSDRAVEGHRSRPEIHDFWPRLILNPVLGVALPNLSGLIDHSRHSPLGIVASYLYFAGISFVIWQGNRWLYLRLQRREDWLLRPWRRLGVLLATILLYTIPVCTLMLWTWRAVTGDPGLRAYAIPTALIAVVAAVVVITHVYETVFLLGEWESDRLSRALTERSRLEAELEAVCREVDPHFLFNHLNALLHLVEQRNEAAAPFIGALSASYRYVLDSRGKRLVPLSAELQTLKHHQTLARIRYGGDVHVCVDIPEADAARLKLPPVTLGELFQNALKHNDATASSPLTLSFRLEGGSLLVESDLRPTAARTPSTGTGLRNLADRVRLATGEEASWGVHDNQFVVRIPLAE